MKRFAKLASLFLAAVLGLYVAAPPLFSYAALGAANALMAFGIAPELVNYITKNMVNVDSSGNMVLPIATGKKLSYTVGGTEQAFLSLSGISSQNGLAFPTTSEEAVAGAGSTNADAAALSAIAAVKPRKKPQIPSFKLQINTKPPIPTKAAQALRALGLGA